ncbi:hypothetical protein K490DRAFT_16572, partial [Saccharata proteae CBS 121410]
PRLTFLYPHLFRSLRTSEQTLSARPARRKPQNSCSRRPLSSSPRRTLETLEPRQQRYGTGVEPQLEQKAAASEDNGEEAENTDEPSPNISGQSPTVYETVAPASPEPPKKARKTVPIPPAPKVAQPNPLEEVLHMPAPAKKPPHLQTPPYVHHFDTYGLVKHLENSGFNEAQSVSVMKAVRAMLADNMELAHAGLVGKSDVENETYLFRAACSELRTEVENNRKAENERMSTQRNQLQHEVDIIGQRLGQDSASMKDELKGMFDDRKMAVRMEQRAMESKIQELNYKITVALNSDARSEVEGLRWVLTRRAVTAIVIAAMSILATLNYSSYMTRTQEQERK